MAFSERGGYKAVRAQIQFECMDDPLRNGIWNVLTDHWLVEGDWHDGVYRFSSARYRARRLYRDFFRLPADSVPTAWPTFRKVVRDWFFSFEWHAVYDLVEYSVRDYESNGGSAVSEFVKDLNSILDREKAGYRLVDGLVMPLTSEEEIEVLEGALTGSPDPVRAHLRCALEMLSDRVNPDYRNSIKESISGVESLCRQIAGVDKAGLGDALDALVNRRGTQLHKALRGAFNQLYGWTSDAEGIRHAMMEEPNLKIEDAKFMLVACAAFVNYVRAKANASADITP